MGLNVLRGQTDIFGTKTCYDVALNVPLVGLTYKGRKRVMMWVLMSVRCWADISGTKTCYNVGINVLRCRADI